jgi:hypothetical protein
MAADDPTFGASAINVEPAVVAGLEVIAGAANARARRCA